MDLTKLKDAQEFCFMINNKNYFDFVHFDIHYGFRNDKESIRSKYVKIITDYQNDFTIKDWQHIIFDYPKIFSTQERFFDYDSLEE